LQSLNYLFCYGTLKPGEEAHSLFKSIKGSWMDAYVYGDFVKDMNIDYPMIQLNENGDKILGQLFYSDELMKIIKSLDDYEGEEYQRVVTNVYLNDSTLKQAFVYEKAK
jgi:gamma-glutamylcyclotransferase (GGCT)/AIG2-like uncharacterized protein YtfP